MRATKILLHKAVPSIADPVLMQPIPSGVPGSAMGSVKVPLRKRVQHAPRTGAQKVNTLRRPVARAAPSQYGTASTAPATTSPDAQVVSSSVVAQRF
jgi:hypothetical protein